MSAHAPGPWGCTDTSYHAHDYRLTRPDGMPLPLSVVANDHSEQRANARLIAAAPDLLRLLTSAVVSCEIADDMGPEDFSAWFVRQWMPKARAAIARARGES